MNVKKWLGRLFAAWLCFIVVCFYLPGISYGAPADISPETKALLGIYKGVGEEFLIRESTGELELLYPIDNGDAEGVKPYSLFPLAKVAADEFRLLGDSPLAVQRAALNFQRDAKGLGVVCQVGAKPFSRQFFGPEQGQYFRIHPLLPVDELKKGAAAKPPVETGIFLAPDLIEIVLLDTSIQLDIRYATDNNFMGFALYDEPRAFLQRPAAEALVRVHRKLADYGLGLVIHDAYRPWYVTKLFWDATPDGQKVFVADPAKGSRHNRGGAVDVDLYDRKTGKILNMISGYDEFSLRAYADYPGGTSLERWYRDLLRILMEGEGFTVYPEEWWHYDYQDWQKYPILNLPFAEIGK